MGYFIRTRNNSYLNISEFLKLDYRVTDRILVIGYFQDFHN